MSSTSVGIPAGRLAQYAMLVASVPGLERRGSKAPYTSLNGNKSSFLTDTGSLALRLDSDGRDAFMRQHHAQLCERHGRVMKEYVAVPEDLWKQRKALRRAFVSSVAYVGSLKPKVSKRKKTAVPKSASESVAAGSGAAPVTSRTAVARKSAKKAAAKKPVAKAASASKKRAASAKATTRKAATRKAATKKPVAKKPVAKKPVAKKAVAKKPVAKKAVAKKAAPRKAAKKKPVAKKTVRRRTAVARA